MPEKTIIPAYGFVKTEVIKTIATFEGKPIKCINGEKILSKRTINPISSNIFTIIRVGTIILNNVNDMKPQEIRNAILGVYSTFIRETARFDPHELFDRLVEKKGKITKEKLKYFSFPLKGRMEVDEWLSELIYLFDNNDTCSHLFCY